ncbi:MAG TPA: hypothetical protein VLB02_00445 [Candidatus Paceibacterota bacterium]|nr:hypothetical protein [Candidatus Paceibacterota bacterium]
MKITHDHLFGHTPFFTDSYIRQNGRIFPWGGFRTYNNIVPKFEDQTKDEGGMWAWSEKLIPYGSPRYYLHMENNYLYVVPQGRCKAVEVLALAGDVYVPSYDIVTVTKNRTLYSPENHGKSFDFGHHFQISGVVPGTELILLTLEDDGAMERFCTASHYRLFTKEGTAVPFMFKGVEEMKLLGNPKEGKYTFHILN